MTGYEKRARAQGAAAVVGVDAGKFEHAMVVRPRGGRDTKPLTFRTSRDGFEKAAAAILAAAGPDATPPKVLVGIEFAGTYGFTFAHFLHQQGFPVVSVLPAHTKKWKEVVHNQNLKTDAKDAVGITDLVSQGHFVSFPFLDSVYADLRYLVSTRERLSLLRRGAITRLKATLEVVFPEYERIFVQITKPTALAVLKAYPCPDALLAAPKRQVMKLLRETSRNHLGAARYDALIEAAAHTLALTGTHRVLKDEVPMLIELIETYAAQIAQVEALMTEALERTPEAPYLLSIPGVAPVTAAVFLGSIGDPAAYDSSKQVLRVAGLTLVERSSGLLKGQKRISKRGRPVFRRHAYIFAVRSVQKDGLFRAEYEALCARNGGRKIAALTVVRRCVSCSASRAIVACTRRMPRGPFSGRGLPLRSAGPVACCCRRPTGRGQEPCNPSRRTCAGLPVQNAPPAVRFARVSYSGVSRDGCAFAAARGLPSSESIELREPMSVVAR